MKGFQFFGSLARASAVLSPAAVVLLAAAILFGGTRGNSPVQGEWVLPGAFTGQGAVTIGCQLWDVPWLTPYGNQNPDKGFAAGSFSPAKFLAIIDGPHGSVTLDGEACGVSVDWRRFPAAERPSD